MRRSNTWSILFTVLFAAMAIYFLLPSIGLYQKDPAERPELIKKDPKLRNKIINLGLDLQGGVRFVLEVDRDSVPENAQKDLLDRAYAIIENRINSLGLTEPVIQKQGEDRLIIELPGLNDEKAAKEVIGSTAKLYFHVVESDAKRSSALEAIENALKGVTVTETKEKTEAKEETKTDEAVKDLFGSETATTEDTTAKETQTETVEVAVKSLSQYLKGYGNEIVVSVYDTAKVNKIFADTAVVTALKKRASSSIFLWGYDKIGENGEFRALHFLRKRAAMSGEDIENAKVDYNQESGATVVSLSFGNKGAKDFSKVTGRNVGKRLAIVLDGTVYSAPNVNEKISQGRAQISGSFSQEEAKRLAVILQAGALPAPMTIEEQNIIGPSLGQDSIEKATMAAIVGFGLVVLFMIVYYKGSGALAVFALFLNVIFILAIMASFGATLTLPGIAGIILIMGMSVDANVIIFERIKEELALGKGVITAIDAGYDKAFKAIMDANVTTLFTAIVLYNIGSGPIRGFAVTLIAGILVSLFTALTFTRMIYHLFTESGKVKKLSI